MCATELTERISAISDLISAISGLIRVEFSQAGRQGYDRR